VGALAQAQLVLTTNKRRQTMTKLDEIKAEVEKKINAIEYDWTDTNNNIRIMLDIRESVDNLPDTYPSAKHIAEVAVACGDYLHLRDFLLGLSTEKPKDKVISYLALLNDILSEEHAVPTITVLSSYMYEMEQPNNARALLDKALEIDPEYPLANLLDRVYNAGWPAHMLTEMSQQLHSNIVKTIETGVHQG
jgi:tetratricopeptide (TPR) repeat protein